LKTPHATRSKNIANSTCTHNIGHEITLGKKAVDLLEFS